MIARGPSTLRLPKVTPMGVFDSFIADTETVGLVRGFERQGSFKKRAVRGNEAKPDHGHTVFHAYIPLLA